jgi:hypothetical protein
MECQAIRHYCMETSIWLCGLTRNYPVFDVLHQVKVSCLVRCAPVASVVRRSIDIFKTNCDCLKGIIKFISIWRLSCKFLIYCMYIYIYIYICISCCRRRYHHLFCCCCCFSGGGGAFYCPYLLSWVCSIRVFLLSVAFIADVKYVSKCNWAVTVVIATTVILSLLHFIQSSPNLS